jgi:hypothetical protein
MVTEDYGNSLCLRVSESSNSFGKCQPKECRSLFCIREQVRHVWGELVLTECGPVFLIKQFLLGFNHIARFLEMSPKAFEIIRGQIGSGKGLGHDIPC